MAKISPITLILLGMLLCGILGVCLTVVLLAVFDTPADTVKVLAPFVSILPPLIAGVFGVLKYIRSLEQRQEQRHRINLRKIQEASDAANRAADTAAHAIEYHEKEVEDADFINRGEEPDVGLLG